MGPLVLAILATAIVITVAFVRGGPRTAMHRQFTLRTLLGIVTLCGLWLSQFHYASRLLDPRESIGVLDISVVLSVWIVLALVYLYQGQFGPMAVHCGGLVFFVALTVPALLTSEELRINDLLWWVRVGVFFGSVVSFPTFMLFTLTRMLRA